MPDPDDYSPLAGALVDVFAKAFLPVLFERAHLIGAVKFDAHDPDFRDAMREGTTAVLGTMLAAGWRPPSGVTAQRKHQLEGILTAAMDHHLAFERFRWAQRAKRPKEELDAASHAAVIARVRLDAACCGDACSCATNREARARRNLPPGWERSPWAGQGVIRCGRCEVVLDGILVRVCGCPDFTGIMFDRDDKQWFGTPEALAAAEVLPF